MIDDNILRKRIDHSLLIIINRGGKMSRSFKRFTMYLESIFRKGTNSRRVEGRPAREIDIRIRM